MPSPDEGRLVLLSSMEPVIAPGARVLVLGSMPGSVSLEKNEYYAHERNRFWPVIEATFDVTLPATYARRLKVLTTRGIALWDVLRHCERAGSLDRRISRETEVPNDIPGLLRMHPTIRRILFNGQKSAQSFHRLVTATSDGFRDVELLTLPSTSPANAGFSAAALIEAWRPALL